jgi:ATP adenylyltransferase
MDDSHGPERLHAPWRMAYVEKTGKTEPCCVFCMAPSADDDRMHLIVHRGRHCFVILNAFPYNSGHLMVVPYAHTADLAVLPPETLAEMMQLSTTAMAALRAVMRPDGFNLGMNLGRAAGAGIADHLHLHVVPRWVGDTNFMPVLGNTRVLPESLERTWEKITAAFVNVTEENGRKL